MAYNELLESTNKIQNDKSLDVITTAVISNVSFDPYFIPLMTKQFFDMSNLRTEIIPIPYEEYDSIACMEHYKSAQLLVIWLNYDSLYPDLESKDIQGLEEVVILLKRFYNYISKYSKGEIIWVLFEDYYNNYSIVRGHNYSQQYFVDTLNIKLMETLSNNVIFVDLKNLIAQIGISNSYDSKGKYRWNAPYSKALIETVIKELHKQYLIEKGITKKCLVLDCDNVLWGGILSEDGVENIILGGSGLGRPYQDFQKFVLSLYYHGVILVISSKNDLSDVLMIFREYGEMILKEEHIACFQVNWKNKPDNIKQISATLNIGLDSMVFIDDSPVEIEAVKSMLPEVTAILYDRDSVYENLFCFNLKSNMSKIDIEKRNETYRTNKSREILKSQYQSYDEYIEALEVKIDIHESLPIEYSRIAELTQRTNKCTNGVRYTVAEIKERVDRNNNFLYSLTVSDRFSDLGLVGAFEIENDTLTLFSLSCRALGREIEEKMLEFIKTKHSISNIKIQAAEKNKQMIILFLNKYPEINFLTLDEK